MNSADNMNPSHSSHSEPVSSSPVPSLPDHLKAKLIDDSINTHAKRTVSLSKREASMTIIREYAPRIIDAADGFKLLSAITVMRMLIQIGKPQPYISAHALGNVLGHEGFKLPSITILGKRRYALHLIESSDGEKAQFQAWLDGLDVASRCSLHVA